MITGEESLPANYLAGRHAANQRDYATAALFFQRALADDPTNMELLERTFLLHFADGNIGEALQLAPRVLKAKPDYKLAKLLLAVKAFKDKKHVTAINGLHEKTQNAAAQLPDKDVTAGLFAAWIDVTRGQGKAALAGVDKLKGDGWVELYKAYHAALIADVARVKPASPDPLNILLEKLSPEVQALRLQEVALNLLLRAGRFEDAKARWDKLPANVQKHPVLQELQAQITAQTMPKPLLASGVEGAAEVFFGLGSILSQDQNQDLAAVYLYLAVWLNPNFDMAWMALGELYTEMNVPVRAIESYRRINQSSVYRYTANLELAANLLESGEVQDAEAVLKLLIEQRPEALEPRTALGSLYRQQKKYELAVSEYSAAIAKITAPEPAHWTLYYYRGMSYERLKKYEQAEQDLETASRLHPDDASLLNYLGYIWADQNKRLEEAKALIEKAVKLRPNNGYYIDSLAWVYFRMGDHKNALLFAQKAVQLRPADSTIVDHFGDILWRTGYPDDARFNWSHALEMKPEEPEDARNIELKLKFGMNKDGKPAQSAAETFLFPVVGE